MSTPGSRIDIDADALSWNLQQLRSEMAPTPLIMVVKANAYGHGVDPIVPLAMDAGQQEFAVFSLDEAKRLLAVAPQARVQVMGHIGWHWEEAARLGVEPWLADIAQWPMAQAAAAKHGLRIHVEVETGMHRTGLTPENALEVLRDPAGVEIVGLCTHLAGAEDPRNAERVDAQLAKFDELRNTLIAEGIDVPPCHVASSSAALVRPDLRMDGVRVGIACYGMWPTPDVAHQYQQQSNDPIALRRVMTWRSSVMAIQDVPAGDCVGYGLSACMTQDTSIAVVPVGYGNGLTRNLSNNGFLLVHGRRCPIVGPVNMNMVQIDVSHLESVEPGDEVVLVGAQGEEAIGIHSFSESQEVVNYEFMARLDKDIPRMAMRPPLAPAN
ncbi:MAG: alanine racemase [Thermoplasmatota archaeon]